MKATYNEIFISNQILSNIPPVMEGRKMPASTVTTILLHRLAHQRKMEEYEEACRKALDELKKDEKYSDFDSRIQAHEEAKSKGNEYDKEFDKIVDGLTEAYSDVRRKQAQVTTEVEIQPMTRKELDDIVDFVGTEGTITISHAAGCFEQERIQFLGMLTNYFTNQQR